MTKDTFKFTVPARTFVVRPGGDLEGAEFVMADMTLAEVAAFEEQRLSPSELQALFMSHIVSHNLDRSPGDIGISYIAGIWAAWLGAIRDGSLPPTNAAS